MKEIMNDKGFTLTEILVGAAVLSISMLALSDMLVLNAKGQRNTTSESDINALFGQIQQIAGSEWSCTASLAGSVSTGAILIKDPINATATVAQEGVGEGKFWTMTQIRMQNVVSVSGQPGVLRGSLYLLASKNAALNIGSPTLSRSVQDVYFELNPDGTIARCYTTSDTVAAAQSACQLIGGTWSAGQICQLPQG